MGIKMKTSSVVHGNGNCYTRMGRNGI